MTKLTPVQVSSRPDLTETIKTAKPEAMAARRAVGPSELKSKEAWGKAGVDLFDGKIGDGDQKAFLSLAMDRTKGGIIGALKTVAAQGAGDPGMGLLQRTDKTGFLDGSISSLAVVSGTATNNNGVKVKGEGAKLEVQVQYEATTAETRKASGMIAGARSAVKVDRDANGKIQNLKARINVEGDVRPDGIRNLSFSAIIENVPAVDAKQLLKKIGSDEIEFPAALPLKVLMQAGAEFNMQFVGAEGMNVGLRGNLEVLDGFDSRIPAAVVSANVDGKMVNDGKKQLFDGGTAHISLDSKVNLLWDDKGDIRLEYQDKTGKYVPYDSKKNFGRELSGDMLMGLIGLVAMGMN